MTDWFLIHTKIRQERVALTNLESQGYTCFLPEISIEKLRRKTLEVVQEPLFPRYLFISLGTDLASQSWAPIRSTLGVSRLVTFGQIPAKIDASLVAVIRAHNEAAISPTRYFAAGDQVIVTEGPFQGLDAIYQMDDGENRAMVLLHFMNKQVKLSVPPGNLRKAH